MSKLIEDRKDQGFTLIELLIAIVVVGILAAVAIVGIAGLTNTGSQSACKSSADSAKAASAAFYANSLNATPPSATPWPATFDQLVAGGNDAVWKAPEGVTPTGTVMTVGNWTLTMSDGGANPTTFKCT